MPKRREDAPKPVDKPVDKPFWSIWKWAAIGAIVGALHAWLTGP